MNLVLFCQKLKIPRVFNVEATDDDRNVLLCEAIVELLKRMNNINSQCINKNGALKGLKFKLVHW